MSSIKYQPEVDGLRAIAILAVVIFHAEETWLPGGFVGVDIFFVISGYLIARILMSNSAMRSKEFLGKRVKRILPAYLWMLVVVLAVGFITLSTEGLYQLSKKVAAALFQVTNLASLSKAPYFATSSLEKPLLHTWSLAVEWQFYLLIAGFLYLFHKGVKAKLCMGLMTALALFSFGLSLYFSLTEEWASHAYYNFFSRFWEFVIGIGVAVLCHRGFSKFAKPASYLGFAAMLAGIVFVSNDLAFPGYWALLPVLGTGAVIYGAQEDTFVKSLFAHKYMVFIGAISYSLYLWHWPVFAYVRYFTSSETISIPVIIVCLVLIIILSLFSYYKIEKQSIASALIFKRVKQLSVALFIVCLTLVLTRGFSHFSDRAFEMNKSKIKCVSEIASGCGDVESDIKILLTGDSHGEHFGAPFEKLSEELGWHMHHVSLGSCVPLITEHKDYFVESKRRKMSCQEQRKFVSESLNDYDKIFMAGRWGAYFEKPDFEKIFRETLAQMVGHRAKIYVIEQVPAYEENGTRLAFLNERYGIALPIPTKVRDTYIEGNNIIKRITSEFPEVKYLSANAMFCETPTQCSPFIGGEFSYIDDNHINIWNARKLSEVLSGQLEH